jgi:hypothetical protein
MLKPEFWINSKEEKVAFDCVESLGVYPLTIATVTGTHQYGFTSHDSDLDVRGVFIAPTVDGLGLIKKAKDHAQMMSEIDGIEVDGVAFEIERFMSLVLKGSGNLIEELFSPIVVREGPYLNQLREAVSANFSKQLIRHYIGFFENCVKKLKGEKKPPEVKTALYAVRIALTGVHLMRTGQIEAHLPTLAEAYGCEFIPEWLSMKTSEHEPIPSQLLGQFTETLMPLRQRLKRSVQEASLPKGPPVPQKLSDLLVKIRRDNYQA